MSGAILNVKKGTFLGYFHPLYSWEESRYSYSMHFFRNILKNKPSFKNQLSNIFQNYPTNDQTYKKKVYYVDRFFKTLKVLATVQSLNPRSIKLYRPNSEIPHIYTLHSLEIVIGSIIVKSINAIFWF